MARSFVLALSVLGCVACSQIKVPTLGVVDAKPVTLAFAAVPPVGLITTETLNFHLDVDVSVSMGGHSASKHLKGDGHSVRTEEVLAVGPDSVTKLRVHYVDDSITTVDEDGSPQDQKPDPREGNTYVVEVTAAGVVVHGADGVATVPDEEAKKVQKDFHSMGDKESWPTGARTYKPGDQVNDLIETVKREAERVGVTVTEASVVFRGQHGDEAVFDLDLAIGKEFSLGDITFSIKGQMGRHIPDGRPSEFAGAGKLTMDAQKGDAEIKGEGTFEAHVKRGSGP